MNRILWNRHPSSNADGGDIDEIVLHDVTVHVEQMDDNCWWIGIYRGERRWTGNFVSKGRMSFYEQDNDGFHWEHEASHDASGWWSSVPSRMGATEVNYGPGTFPLRCYNGEWEAVTVGEGYSPVGPLVQRALDCKDIGLVPGLPIPKRGRHPGLVDLGPAKWVTRGTYPLGTL